MKRVIEMVVYSVIATAAAVAAIYLMSIVFNFIRMNADHKFFFFTVYFAFLFFIVFGWWC